MLLDCDLGASIFLLDKSIIQSPGLLSYNITPRM